MEQAEVIIVGAGPSGLALSQALALRKVKNIVLESNTDITLDPRAIALTGDASRILHLLGLDESALKDFSQDMDLINFHRRYFFEKAFFDLRINRDWGEQTLTPVITMLQPAFEQKLRDLLHKNNYSDLRTGCSVIGRVEMEHSVVVTYQDSDGAEVSIQGSFLVGADGKRGIVRKKFLEPEGITQSTGIHQYASDWVPANLIIHMPTPESHPQFPLWEYGYTSEELWDLFWPPGFHFCNHPTMPVAAGRFGPKDSKYFRFEYERPPGTPACQDIIAELKDQIVPHITIPARNLPASRRPSADSVQFPWDCVEVIRCAPVFFTHKVVNRWYHNRTIIIGDAAHVFPPFGGQGIATGLRDALALSWRLALLCGKDDTEPSSGQIATLLDQFSRERHCGINQSSHITMTNGDLLCNKSILRAEAMNLISGVLKYFPSVRDLLESSRNRDRDDYRSVSDGYFLHNAGGGVKTAQVWLSKSDGANVGEPFLSDELFSQSDGVLTLLVLGDQWSAGKFELQDFERTIDSEDLLDGILASRVAIVRCSSSSGQGVGQNPHFGQYQVTTMEQIKTSGKTIRIPYSRESFSRRFAPDSLFALVRSDFTIFSQAKSLGELREQLLLAKEMAT